MNLLCWLLGHLWESRWRVTGQGCHTSLVVVCLRCGTEREYQARG